jgi:tRNA-dihydrouridine synthase A
VLDVLIPYTERHLSRGGRLNNVARHILGLYHGRPRARAFRRHLSEFAPREGAGIGVLLEAIHLVEGAPETLAAAE